MAVTRYMTVKSSKGETISADLGAKAKYVTIQSAEGGALLNAQSEFERMWQVDSDLDDKIDKEIADREQAILDEEKVRKKAVQDLADALEKAVGDLAADIEGAIDSARETANGMVTELDNDLQAQIDSLNTQVDALEEIVLVEEEQLITEETNVPFVETEKAYKYILLNCSYNGNRLPVQKVLADGEPTELVFYSVGEEELLYYSLKATVAEGGLGITDMKANSEAEFKILSIYGCN